MELHQAEKLPLSKRNQHLNKEIPNTMGMGKIFTVPSITQRINDQNLQRTMRRVGEGRKKIWGAWDTNEFVCLCQ